MLKRMNRRAFVVGTSGLAAGAALHVRQPATAAPTARILDTRVISHLAHRYHGWPTMTRRTNGELLLVFSGGRETHVCPFGRVELMRSHDEGASWSWPRIVLDGPLDERDSGVVETAHGTLLITTFTSRAYETVLAAAEKDGDWAAEKLARWRAVNGRVSAAQRSVELGVWISRSTDGGATWSPRYDSLVHSPHGPLQLADGRLLYAGKDLWRDENRVGVCESADDGRTWKWLATIPVREGDEFRNYHELHGVQAASGRLIVHIRNHNRNNGGETLQSESDDGGETWSIPRPTGIWGLPSHLLRLQDNRLLMSYGHRRKPLGNQVRVSEDEGRTWSDPIGISEDGVSGDLGYPTTVELHDGTLLTVWYELMQGSEYCVLRQARWSLG